MTRRLFPWVLFLLSLLANIYLVLLLVNAGALMDDTKSRRDHFRERNQLVLSILRKEWVGKESNDVNLLAKEIERQGEIVKRAPDGSFEIGDVIFEIKDGVVTNVRYFD